MISSDQLNELENTIKSLYTSGNNEQQQEILQTWFKNPEYFSLTKYIIEKCIPESSTPKIMLTHFAIRSCCSLLDYVCPTWSDQDFINMSQWCLNIFMNEINHFVLVPLLMQAFCNLYAQLVVFGWHVSSEFQDFTSFINFGCTKDKTDGSLSTQSELFWEHILCGSAAQWCGRIRLYTAIVEKMTFIHNIKTTQVDKFKEEPLFQCFDFAVRTLDILLHKQYPPQYSQDEIFILIEYSLQLLNACLSFDDDSIHNDNIETTKIVLPPSWSSYKKFTQIVDCLFQLYELAPPNLQREFLKVLFLFSSIQSSLIIPHEIQYAEPFFSSIHRIISKLPPVSIINDDNLPLMINIILKILLLAGRKNVPQYLQSNYDDLSKNLSFLNFIQTIDLLTKSVFDVHFLLKSPDSIINVLKFWELLSSIINDCSIALEDSDFNIREIEKIENEKKMIKLKKNYVLDEADSVPLRNFVQIVKPLIANTINSYTQLLIQVVQQQPEAAHEIFLSDLTQTNHFMKPVLPIGRVIGEDFYKYILDGFKSLLSSYQEDPNNLVTELQLCLFAMIISPPVFQKFRNKMAPTNTLKNMMMLNNNSLSQSQSQPFILNMASFSSFSSETDGDFIDHNFDHTGEYQYFSYAENHAESMFTDVSMIGILELFKKTYELIVNGNVNNIYMEEVILYIITQFITSNFISDRNPIPLPQIVTENTGFSNSTELREVFLHRIITSISTFSTNNRIISLAMNSISQWTDKVVVSEKVIFITELLEVYYKNLAMVFDSMHTKHIRVQFHQIIGQVIDYEPKNQIFYSFFQGISVRYEQLLKSPDENLALGLILDLRGIISGIEKSSEAYNLSFDYIFPKLKLFHDMGLNFPSIFNQYLKFLTEFTDIKKQRILFPRHSANGLKLAKAAMAFSIAFFDHAPRSLDQSSKCLYYTIKIMENIFSSGYSNLGAMIAYNDPIIIQIFTSFLNFAHVIDFNDIVRYPKHLIQIIRLMECLFNNFSDFIVNIDISFLRTALIICTYFNNPSDYDSIKKTFRVISSITDCCVRLDGTPKGKELFENTRETFCGVLQMLETFIMKMKFSIQFQDSDVHYEQLIELTKNVLRMKPSNWTEIRQRLSLFLKSLKDERAKKLIDDLVSIK